MRVAGPPPSLQLSNTASQNWQRSLAPGQILNAVVIDASNPGSALLRVGALELIARTELALARGQPLVLRVLKGGEVPELQVARASPEQSLLAQALRSALPRQGGLGTQLAGLAAAWRQVPDRDAAPLARAVAVLLERTATTGTDAAALRQAVLQSGVFFEARLARGVFDPADLKGQLLRLLGRLRPGTAPAPEPGTQAPGGTRAAAGGRADAVLEVLRQQAEDALATVRWQQLNSLPDDTGRGPVWHLALPLRTPADKPADLCMRAQRESDGREPGGRHWTVDLSITLEPLGPLHARLSLSGEELSATLWAEHPTTAVLLDHDLGRLRAGLERAGLAVTHLATRVGRPPTPADQPAVPLAGLLDERA